ncbi:MAG: TetR/AcrR family transcriptional regulator [Frankiaceae bacterium]|nr:TetR/AcrR family transcriptional regulator [Frankiaceae bacterium]MBV9870931.1 TetR/AcrR family transcriptional regulator [Frankiaceae bacterium]
MAQVRRTQAERTAATRAALLKATIDTLVEDGHRRTTTQAVAKRAGVSYGALLHHFPAKADLLTAAVAHLLDQRVAEFRKSMANVPPGGRTKEAAIDVLWTMFQGETFTAWLELSVAARTDPDLAVAVERVDREFHEASLEIFRELFAEETRLDPELPRVAVATLYTFLDGLALSRLMPGSPLVDPDQLLEVFKMLIAAALPTPEETA